MPPAPILIAAVILLGYPLVQSASIRIRRPWRLRHNALAAELLACPQMTDKGRERIKKLQRASRGEPATLKRFAKIPGSLFSFEVNHRPEVPHGDTYHDPEIYQDPRDVDIALKLNELHILTLWLEFASHPISFALMMAVAYPMMLLGALIARVRGTNPNARPRLSDIGEALAMSHGPARFA